jgi:endonuclease YncB( thermonuclease family)
VDLETRVRSINATAIKSGEKQAAQPVELLAPRRGTPGLHAIVDRGSGPEVDLGFKFYRELSEGAARLRPYKTGEIVRFASDGSLRRAENATKDQLFTYAATVRRVIDGDTLVVALAVAPGFSHELKLRLRGLDCPEISTAAGRAAKAFVDGLLKPGDEIVVSTAKPDKYDRYLADVFIDESDEGRVVSDELKSATRKASASSLVTGHSSLFLNNALLERGHAVRYDGGAKEE